MIMTDKEKTEIEKWRVGLKEDISLRYYMAGDKAGRKIEGFCREIAAIVPQIIPERKKDPDSNLSYIISCENIIYSALPVSGELGPFLGILAGNTFPVNNVPERLLVNLKGVKTPAVLKIHISSVCPYCPKTVSQCIAVAQLNPLIRVQVIDSGLYPALAEKDRVRSVPTLILDDTFRWTGTSNQKELVTMILQRDPVLLSTESIKTVLFEGNAEMIAEMMAERGEVFPAFLELLLDTDWKVRLGAMAAFEYLAEKSPDLCCKINTQLCTRFPHLDDRLRGDIIYLFGESKDHTMIPFLNSLLKGSFSSEVIEAVEDALDTLLK